MRKSDLKKNIENLLKENPKLNYAGISLPQIFRKKETSEQKKARLEELRNKLLTEEGIHEVKSVMKWLQTSKRARRTKLMNTKYSSFGLKTYVEQSTGTFISNGSFIVGAMLCGCRAEQVKQSENAHLNLRIR